MRGKRSRRIRPAQSQLILPKDLMRAERAARAKQLDVVGYYHRTGPSAVPSQFDLDHAPAAGFVIHYRFGKRGKSD
jgi:proteasome lid subunit RPN8/RPN11